MGLHLQSKVWCKWTSHLKAPKWELSLSTLLATVATAD